MVIIKVSNLKKILNGKLILDGVSFEVDLGDSFCLLGPNGAGKTTTIRVLMGIYRPNGGRVLIKDLDVSKDLYKIKMFVGYLPENPSLYERLTVYRNLKFYGKLYDISNSELDRRIREVTELLGLRDRINEKVGKLSKGLKQRVALARALINKPLILILDQPTSDLDPGMARSIRDFIRGLNREQGTTLLVCTHNLVEAEEICDKVALINRGRIIDSGYINELKDKLVKDHVFEITLLNLANKYLNLLQNIDYIYEVKLLDNYTLYLRLADRANISDAIGVLVKYGAKIYEVKPLKPRLEDVYLEYLGEGK